VTTTVIELREPATEISSALTSPMVGPRLREAATALAGVDGVIASTPV
jgi:FMN reductase